MQNVRVNNLLAKISIVLTITAILCFVAYGVYQQRVMYDEVDFRLATDKSILKHIGKYKLSSLVQYGSDCGYEGSSCQRADMEFKVEGDAGCIHVRVELYEWFPVYKVINIYPITLNVRTYIDSELVSEKEEVQKCKLA